MAITKISPKFQVIIPKAIREQLHLKKGQKMLTIIKDGAVVYIPDRPLGSLKGFLKGLDTERGLRDDEERL